tara:strand:+ start:361966 stop:362289 length:324 start_codon:yes stop_codon:yes gene_type:complete
MNKQHEADAANSGIEWKLGMSAEDLRHLSPETFANIGMPSIVYVREVLARDLDVEFIDAMGAQMDIALDTKLFAVHAANGQCMAVLDDRAAAFAGARQYDLEPQSVH